MRAQALKSTCRPSTTLPERLDDVEKRSKGGEGRGERGGRRTSGELAGGSRFSGSWRRRRGVSASSNGDDDAEGEWTHLGTEEPARTAGPVEAHELDKSRLEGCGRGEGGKSVRASLARRVAARGGAHLLVESNEPGLLALSCCERTRGETRRVDEEEGERRAGERDGERAEPSRPSARTHLVLSSGCTRSSKVVVLKP